MIFINSTTLDNINK